MNLKIKGNKIILNGNRGFKNLGDELILIGLIKLLLEQKKEIFVACTHKDWLRNFHKQFLTDDSKGYELEENELGFYDKKTGKQIITYIQELPKGFRSAIRFIKNFSQIKYYFKADSFIIGGGEILTEETPFSYWYWFLSVFPFLWKNIYLMGGIQKPKKLRNKLVFFILRKLAKKIYTRDYDLINEKKVEFFPDTSLFVVLGNPNYKIDEKNFKWIYKKPLTKQKLITVNINKKAEKFFPKVLEIIENYYKQNYIVKFARICKSEKDNDLQYYEKLKIKFPSIQILDREHDFWKFLDTLSLSEKVFSTRLHLFLISYYLDLNVQAFVYEKKVEKMKKVLNKKK